MRRIRFIVPVILFFLLVFPSSAATSDIKDIRYSSSQSEAWDAKFILWFSQLDSTGSTEEYFRQELWRVMDRAMGAAGYGRLDSLEDMETAAYTFNRTISAHFSQGYLNPFYLAGFYPKASVAYIPTFGAYVLYDQTTGLVLTTSGSAYTYYIPETESGDEVNVYGGKWIGSRTCDSTNKVVILSDDVLSALALTLNESGESCVTRSWSHAGQQYTVICKDNYYYYCNSDGYPYVSRVEDKSYASNQENNYYVDMGDDNVYNEGDTINGDLIDVEDNTVWFPDGTLYYISQLVYDESTRTYYVDAHSEYDIDNNYYISNNYHYEYHINYTSITYIGASEEYNKTYELYYELPDGRSSADLTADELLALNTSIDVVPYIRSSDNTALRSLYHFDANVNDSSYWNYLTNFTWNTGASITYLESNAFNGCLYLDEGEHDFTLTLPSSLGAKDFTLQFRYYQSNTLAPVEDSYISFGNTQVLSMNGGAFFLDGSSVDTPIGNWAEIALVRHGNNLYLYINGVAELVTEADRSFTNEITFHFGGEQQTYKQLDELRILDFAIAENGAYYTPTAVPYDTNLALVLPDSTLPVADEYWCFNANGNLFPTYDYTVGEVPDGLFSKLDTFVTSTIKWGDVAYHYSGKWGVYYRSGSALSDFLVVNPTSIQFSNPSTYTSYSSTTGPLVGFSYGLAFCTNTSTEFTPMNPLGLIEGRDYTFTVMLSDGDSASVTFTYNGFSTSSSLTSALLTSGCRIGVRQAYQGYAPTENDLSEYITAYSLFIIPPAQSSVDVIYMELVEGDTPNSGHELLSYIAPIADFKTPTLAVRTDLEITGYQIGGVRPSLPTKGLVWALVEDGRITSLQVYNGQAWEAVDGRIWTGSRWVPYYAYDVLLLKDMYDIIEADPSQEYIYTEAGFWSWLQKAWGQMMAKLEEIRLAIVSGGSGGGSVPDDSVLPGGSDGSSADGDGGWSFLDLLIAVKDGVWKVTTGLVSTGVDGVSGLIQSVNNVGDYFDAFDSDSSANILGIYSYGGDDIWD